jgi:hypothetical protein
LFLPPLADGEREREREREMDRHPGLTAKAGRQAGRQSGRLFLQLRFRSGRSDQLVSLEQQKKPMGKKDPTLHKAREKNPPLGAFWSLSLSSWLLGTVYRIAQ